MQRIATTARRYARRGRRRALELASSVRQAATSRSAIADGVGADGAPADGATRGDVTRGGATRGGATRGDAGAGVNPLEEYFWNNTGRGMHKWHHYFDIYHRHLAEFRGRPLTVLEFGVASGGSLQMWKHYFGDQAHITGVDILEKCLAFTEDRVDVVLGDQADRGFLRELGERLGTIDVLIEDGGHHPEQQIATFETLWPRINEGGVFLIEDLHTSYIPKYGGGHQRPGTFIEYSKNLIDQMHGWRSREPERFGVDDYTRTIGGMHVYESVIVFDKARVSRPKHSKTGGGRPKPVRP